MKEKWVLIRSFCFRSSFFGALSLASINIAHAIVPTVVAPNGLANTEGNTGNYYPFCLSQIQSPPNMRYQQLFAASQFAGISGFITQLIFRPDAGAFAFSSISPDIQINLSTTTTTDDHLSGAFANNVGANDTIVFARGPLALSSAFTGPPGGPKDFDIIINLTTPFFYDPSMGNLLLDVRNFGGGGPLSFFDAQNVVGDGVSRVCTLGSGVNSNIADIFDSVGLVTGFTIVVPEPRGTALLFTGGVLLMAFSATRRQSRRG